MLRALVHEGIVAARHGIYTAQFHGWHVRVGRGDSPSENSIHVDIRSRDSSVRVPDVWWTIGCVNGEVV
nr:hypothetical protein [Paraburkholderia sp. Cy-641]